MLLAKKRHKTRMSEDRKRNRPSDERSKLPPASYDEAGSIPKHRFVDTPATNDVLFGRGAPIIRWQGNVKFRELIRGRKEEYLATRRHAHKDTIAREVIQEIEERRGGRFLKRGESSTSSEDDFMTGLPRRWMLAEESLIIEKVKQALRDREAGDNDGKKSSKKQKTESKDKGSSDSPSRKGSHGSMQSESRPSVGFASADTTQSRSMATAPSSLEPAFRSVDVQSAVIADLQQRLHGQAPYHLDSLFQLGGQSHHSHLSQLPFGAQLPGFGGPSLSANMIPSNEALLQLEAIRLQRLQLHRLLNQQPQGLLSHSPAQADSLNAALAWLQARQQVDSQQQTMARLLQDTIRVQAAAGAMAPSVPPMRNDENLRFVEPREPVGNQQMQNQESSSIPKEEESDENDSLSSSTR